MTERYLEDFTVGQTFAPCITVLKRPCAQQLKQCPRFVFDYICADHV